MSNDNNEISCEQLLVRLSKPFGVSEASWWNSPCRDTFWKPRTPFGVQHRSFWMAVVRMTVREGKMKPEPSFAVMWFVNYVWALDWFLKGALWPSDRLFASKPFRFASAKWQLLCALLSENTSFLADDLCSPSVIWVRPFFRCVKWKIVTWLILPVVICLSQRLSHACLSINNSILWNCEWLIKSVKVYLIIPYYLDNRSNSRANTC